MATNKLFWQHPYKTSCRAKIVRIKDTCVELDQTIFYAESGGQPSDKGTIGGIPVLKATKEGSYENSTIWYELKFNPFFPGQEVEIAIEGTYRKQLMQMHTALHVLYFFVQEEIGIKKVFGSQVSPKKARF